MYSVISGPPPWTITGFEPDVLEQDDVAGELVAQRRLAHRRAAVLDHHGAAVELADVGKRLEQRLDAAGGGGALAPPRFALAHVVYSAFSSTYSWPRSLK